MAPKAPISAYLLFCKKKREKVHCRHPELNPKDVTVKLGKKWKSLGEEGQVRVVIDVVVVIVVFVAVVGGVVVGFVVVVVAFVVVVVTAFAVVVVVAFVVVYVVAFVVFWYTVGQVQASLRGVPGILQGETEGVL